MLKHLRKLNLILTLVLLFTFFYAFIESQPEELVVVPYSNDSGDIIEDLKNRGYLKNKFSYLSLVFLSKFYKDIEPGGYNLKQGMGALAIHTQLTDPDYKYVFVQEGLRKEEVASVLEETLDWEEGKKDMFTNNLSICSFTGGEGYLFPGKYLIHKDEDIYVIKKEMENRLLISLKKLEESPDSRSSIIDTSRIVKIASLIQREAAGKGDMRLISGIIWNRLFNEMPLQIDATLQYITGDNELWWPRVKSKDKFIDSPYNTYQNEGLPPGPIANPGLAAISAALNPVDTDCIFYLHDNYRNIHCATTYSVHKRNVDYYLK